MRPIIDLNVPETLRNGPKDAKFRVFYAQKHDELEIYLSGIIGDEYTESDAASIQRLLRANRGRPVTMRINSGGGLAFDGLAIHNALAEHDGPTTSIIEALAASAASLAAIGADRVLMQENATYHIHEGLTIAFGHIAELQESISWLESFNAAAALTYSAKTGKVEKDIRSALRGKNGDGTKYAAAEALEFGFVDEIIPLKAAKKKDNKTAAHRTMRNRFLKSRLTEIHRMQ